MARTSSTKADTNGRTLTPRAQATRERVLKVTRECIIESGPLNISSNEIARRAGVSWGVFQYHFGTVDGLLIALVEQGMSSLQTRLEAIDPTGLDLEERLRAFVDAAWGYYTQPEYMVSADVLRALRGSGESRARVDKILRRSEADLERLWGTLVQSHLPPDGPSAKAVERLVLASLRGLAVHRSIKMRPYREERQLLVEAISGMLTR